jgi:hypothetical protein
MTDATMTRALADAVGANVVAAELRRKIANERARIRADVEGFHVKKPPVPGTPAYE